MPKIKNRKIISRTNLFRVDQLDINFDTGQDRQYEVICGTGNGAVMVIPILDSQIIFIREYAAAIDDYSLTLPKGKIDDGETVMQAANRELQEEIGYLISKGGITTNLILSNGLKADYVFLQLCGFD